MRYSSLKCSSWHMLTRDHTVLPVSHTCIHIWNEPYLPLLPSYRASLHFGRYSFPIPCRVGGRVGLGGWLHAETVCPFEDGCARCRVTSLMCQCHYHYAMQLVISRSTVYRFTVALCIKRTVYTSCAYVQISHNTSAIKYDKFTFQICAHVI